VPKTTLSRSRDSRAKSESELTDIREHNESMQGDSDGDAVGVISPGDLYRPPYTVRCRSCKVVFAVSNHWDDTE
jgi:hypothetical protein